jgi:choline dehydrogenase-like flavoprotein
MEPREFKPGEIVHCDVCIIGSGAAGLTMGAKFATKHPNLRVVILESSTKDVRQPCAETSLERVRREMTLPADLTCHRYQDDSVQPFYNGKVFGDAEQCDPNFLTRHRIRVYGGTTNCWGGVTRTLQPIDFTRTRSGLGWPIGRAELDQAYAEAMYYCSLTRDSGALDIPLAAYDNPSWFVGKTDKEIETLRLPSDSPVRSGAFTIMAAKNPDIPYDGQLDFQLVWGPSIAKSGNVQVLRNANVRRFRKTAGTATEVDVGSFVGGQPAPATGKLYAKVFVVAAGGIESTRLLMLSELASPQLGKRLMVHPLTEWNSPAMRIWSTPKGTVPEQDFYGAHDITLKDRGFATQVRAVLIPTDKALADRPWMGNFRALVDLHGNWTGGGNVNFNWEQAPNPENCVAFGTSKDAFGDPLLNLTWNMGETDWKTLDEAATLTGNALVNAGYADGYKYTRPPVADLLMGDHPMGTTRMTISPADGVVDPNCQVHDLRNVYVASSSVFPVAGWSNPTLTIVALAARLTGYIATHMPP